MSMGAAQERLVLMERRHEDEVEIQVRMRSVELPQDVRQAPVDGEVRDGDR